MENKKAANICGFLKLADRTGLEPATTRVTGGYSNQLNYRSNTDSDLVGGTRLELVTHAL
jgi:hypothetical protein